MARQHYGVATETIPAGYRVWSDRSCFGLGLFGTREAAEVAMAQFVAAGWEGYDLRIVVEPGLERTEPDHSNRHSMR